MWPGSCYVKLQMSLISANALAQSAISSASRIQTRPRLSIVLLSSGAIDQLHAALTSVIEAPFFLETELVVVRACGSDEEKGRLQRLSRQLGFVLELAPANSTRAFMAAQGAGKAGGDIVTVRVDAAASDNLWLSSYLSPAEPSLWEGAAIAEVEATEAIPGKGTGARAPLADRAELPVRPLGAQQWLGDSSSEHPI